MPAARRSATRLAATLFAASGALASCLLHPSDSAACRNRPAPSVTPHAFAISRRAQLLALAQCVVPVAVSAKYGEFAKVDTNAQMAAGDASNECLFAIPGSGICTVYRSSEPPIWSSPDTSSAMTKLLKATKELDNLAQQIQAARWTAVTQVLGSSRDLREAVGFLTAAAGTAEASAAAKRVFRDLDGIALAAQKKSKEAASSSFAKYLEDMPTLLKALS